MNFMNFEALTAMHDTGLQFGKTIVLYGAGFSRTAFVFSAMKKSSNSTQKFSARSNKFWSKRHCDELYEL